MGIILSSRPGGSRMGGLCGNISFNVSLCHVRGFYPRLIWPLFSPKCYKVINPEEWLVLKIKSRP